MYLKEAYFSVPLAFINKLERTNDKKSPDMTYLDIYSKDGRIFKATLSEKSHYDSISFFQYLNAGVFPDKKDSLFAFEYGKANKELEEKHRGWRVYDVEKEFLRQGADFRPSYEKDNGSNNQV